MPPLEGFAPGRERACHVEIEVVRAGHAPLPDLPEPAATDLDEAPQLSDLIPEESAHDR